MNPCWKAYLDPPNPTKDLVTVFKSYGFQSLLGPLEDYGWWPLFNARVDAPAAAPSAIEDGTDGEAGVDPSAVVVSNVGVAEDVKQVVGHGGAVSYYLMAAKLLIFLIYIIVIACVVDGSDRALGFATACCLIILDALTWYYRRIGTIVKTEHTVMVMAASRLIVVLFGERLWFLGHAVLFAFHGTILCWNICAINLSEEEHTGAMQEARAMLEAKEAEGEELTELEKNVKEKLENPPKTKKQELEEMSTVERLLFSPRGALMLMSVAYGIDLIIVWVCACSGSEASGSCDTCSLKVYDLTAIDKSYAQWVYGLGAIFYLIIISLAFISYFLGDTRKGFMFTGLCLAVSIVGGLILYASSGSNLLLAWTMCLPTMFFILVNFFRRWRDNDFDVFILTDSEDTTPVTDIPSVDVEADNSTPEDDISAVSGMQAGQTGGTEEGSGAGNGSGYSFVPLEPPQGRRKHPRWRPFQRKPLPPLPRGVAPGSMGTTHLLQVVQDHEGEHAFSNLNPNPNPVGEATKTPRDASGVSCSPMRLRTST